LRRDFYYAFSEKKYPGVPEINLNKIDENPFTIGDVEMIPILVWHLKMPVLGFRMGNFTYITDANRIDDKEKGKIVGSEVLVLNALRNEKHISHFTLAEAIQLATELKVPKVYFTHISHQLGKHETVNKKLPPHIRLAFDGLTIDMHI
jgi:phosphoribosyl 1,2-cyclic phosphate phosphodiesterase